MTPSASLSHFRPFQDAVVVTICYYLLRPRGSDTDLVAGMRCQLKKFVTHGLAATVTRLRF
jgi:hypothetical protein